MVNEHVFDPKLIWLTSATASFCIVLTLITCLCGCKRKIPKGSNALATATRSLPDLPVDSGEASEKLWDPPENNVDTNSDLYATVEDANRKKRILTSGLTVDSSYTPSQTDDSLSPYARLKGEHPYDQLKQNEHPYAQVGPNGTLATRGASTSQDTTVNSTPSSRRGLETERDDEDNKSATLSEITDEIPAASAIAGSVPANHDLPYMTPPIPNPVQQHFSGDSVDSSKGYTSISVREPLARIMASSRRNGSGDPHYATVSDDSDEMYAAIEEHRGNGIVAAPPPYDTAGGEYTSGSETYAQIAPPSSHHPLNLTLNLNLQHQDSVSSGGSAESPRRDRRVANSPLPEVPALDDMYAKVMKKGRSPTSPEPPDEPPTSNTGRCDELQNIPGYETLNTDPNYEELQPQIIGHEPDYASLSRRYESSVTDPNYESVGSSLDPPYERVNTSPMPEDPPDYEVVCSRPGQPALEPFSDLYAQVNKTSEKRRSSSHE
ncbi:uncharacterized protein LOC106668488 isoform X2 [Cimex lectularius]|uniref:Uncharacterized protein n=1 Tax=Cimex lectularius TaxID=79782 RepID=A0A8I6RWP2_CIMLE|nr:uncharacterized protein LOC106668488 isoform X2 [Cimex lectularius]